MSRIAGKSILLSENVNLTIMGQKIKVKGSQGELIINIASNYIRVDQSDRELKVVRENDQRDTKAKHGLYTVLLKNAIQGVVSGFQKKLELVGVGYRAQKKGNGLVMQLGYSHPINVDPVAGILFELEGDTKITVKGIDKQLVGQVAANIRSLREPEPYKGKGVKYADEYIRRKAGKAGKAK